MGRPARSRRGLRRHRDRGARLRLCGAWIYVALRVADGSWCRHVEIATARLRGRSVRPLEPVPVSAPRPSRTPTINGRGESIGPPRPSLRGLAGLMAPAGRCVSRVASGRGASRPGACRAPLEDCRCDVSRRVCGSDRPSLPRRRPSGGGFGPAEGAGCVPANAADDGRYR
jgi:hypothetical protein